MILDQIAYYAHDDDQADIIAASLGLPPIKEWVVDIAVGHAIVRTAVVPRLVGKLRFCYSMKAEVEILTYLEGLHWHMGKPAFEARQPFLSHIGYHLVPGEVMPDYFSGPLVQELWTTEHSNTNIPKDRTYRYRIFESSMGVDQKIIRRIDNVQR